MLARSTLLLARRSVSVARSAVPVVQTRGYADDGPATAISLTFTTPHLAYYDAVEVTRVDVPGLGGDFGVMPQHVPVLDCLRPGTVNVVEGDTTTKYFVSSGTVTVNGDSSMQIIAEEAVPVAELDLAAAKSGLDKASAKLGSSNDAEKAEAEISVETFTQMIKAIEA